MTSSDLGYIARIRSASPGQRVALNDDLSLFRIPKQRYRNGQSFALRDGAGTLLIDTVHGINRQAVEALLDERPATALLLTHSDLLGQAWCSAGELAHWLGDVPILIHSYDIGSRQGLHPLESNTPLLEDLEVAYFHVPGHTPGSTAYLHRPTGSLFTGDIIVGNNYEKKGQYFTHAPIQAADWEAHCKGWAAIPEDEVSAVLPLHGQPSFGGHCLREAREAGLQRNRLMRE